MSTRSKRYDADARFAELRALLNGPFVSYEALGKIYRLAKTHHAHAPNSYHEQWKPYMLGFPKFWTYPLTTLRSLVTLEESAHILPFALFNLDLNATPGLPKDWPHVLAHMHELECIHELHLAHLSMTKAHLHTLMSSQYLKTLKRLNLWNVRIGIEGAEILAECETLRTVEVLQLGRNFIGPKGITALIKSPHFNQVKKAWLSQNELRDRGAEILANASGFESLKELDIGSNIIGRRGAEAFAKAPRSSQLTRLDFHGNQLGERGERALANSAYLSDEIRKPWRDMLNAEG